MIRTIDILKNFAICLVVIGHSVPNNVDNPFIVSITKEIIYSFHMPLFMFLSGYLFEIVTLKKNNKYIGIITNKFNRLVFPFLFWGTVGFLIKSFASDLSYRPYELTFSFYIKGLLHPTQAAVSQYWFLFVLFLIFLFYPIMTFGFSRKNNFYTLILIVILIVLNILNPLHNVDFLCTTELTRFLIFFMGGCSCSFYFKKKLFLMGRLPVIISLCCLFIYVFSINVYPPGKLFLLSSLGIGFSLALCSWLDSKKIKLIPFINGYSYQIFLLAWFIQNPIRNMYQLGFLSYYPTIILMITSGLIVPVLITKFVTHNFPQISFIIGLKRSCPAPIQHTKQVQHSSKTTGSPPIYKSN